MTFVTAPVVCRGERSKPSVVFHGISHVSTCAMHNTTRRILTSATTRPALIRWVRNQRKRMGCLKCGTPFLPIDRQTMQNINHIAQAGCTGSGIPSESLRTLFPPQPQPCHTTLLAHSSFYMKVIDLEALQPHHPPTCCSNMAVVSSCCDMQWGGKRV
jgi:hypothetical protein